jgi:hypothetical protein
VLEVLTATLPNVADMLRDGRIEHALVAVAFGHLALAAAGDLQRPANL